MKNLVEVKNIKKSYGKNEAVKGISFSIEEDERLTQMYAAIAKLKDLEKAIVMLYLEDYSYEKIANILGISSNHIGVKLHRIKLKLKQMLQEK